MTEPAEKSRASYHKKWRDSNLEHRKAWEAEWREKNRDQRNSYLATWRANNRDRIKANKLYSRYRLTDSERLRLLDAQGGKCLICGSSEELVVDHNHETKQVRGLLCPNCNKGIGLLKDSSNLLYSSVAYLQPKEGFGELFI